MRKQTKSVQRVIRWYAISAVVLTGFVIALVVMVPLQTRLFDMQKQHLIFSRDVGVLVVDSCFQGVREIAKQISLRIKGRRLLSEYDEGKITLSAVQEALKAPMKNNLDAHTDLLSIDRFDKKGDLLLSVGQKIIPPDLAKSILEKRSAVFESVVFDEKNYLAVSTPIFNAEKNIVGYDIFTFELNKLRTLVEEKLHPKLGEIFLYYVQDNRLNWISPYQSSMRINPSIFKDNEINTMLINSVENNKSGTVVERFKRDGILITYAPIPGMSWGVMVAADNMDLRHAVQHVILVLSFIVVLILLLFGVGLAAVLRPLSGRLLMENRELEALVHKSQEKLKTLNHKLYQMVMIDSLTGAATRHAFYERAQEEISRSKRYGRHFTLLFMDIDEFKIINDSLGHDAGDFLLQAFSARIIKLIRKEDVFGRLGGDEFALLLPEKSTSESVAEVVMRIKMAVEKPMEYKKNAFSICISIGFAIYPFEGETIDDLLKAADQKMYLDKRKNN